MKAEDQITGHHDGGEDEDNELNVAIIKLISGEVIVGDIDVEFEQIEYMSSIVVMLPFLLIEQINGDVLDYMLRQWMPCMESGVITIKTSHIMYIEPATDIMVSSYANAVVETQSSVEDEDEDDIMIDEDEDGKTIH